jgi:ABC-type Zn uptake system ZnuABC Zn-binding protein ZnuA
MMKRILVCLILFSISLSGCKPAAPATDHLRVIAVESFLADLAQQVAGDRIQVDALIPPGVDPHGFELTPADLVRLSEADLIIQNGQGLESWLEKTLKQSNNQAPLLNASEDLQPRNSNTPEADPHFWLDPTLTVKYINNIRDGLIQLDPGGEITYKANAEQTITRLHELDQWIKDQVQQIPPERRLLITNHESFGYYADRYGFQVVGAIIPSITTGSTPTAQEIATLIDQIKKTGAPAIFIETGANPQIAEQISGDTGVKVVEDLYTHALSEPNGPAPDYFSMMRWNTTQIVTALK